MARGRCTRARRGRLRWSETARCDDQLTQGGGCAGRDTRLGLRECVVPGGDCGAEKQREASSEACIRVHRWRYMRVVACGCQCSSPRSTVLHLLGTATWEQPRLVFRHGGRRMAGRTSLAENARRGRGRPCGLAGRPQAGKFADSNRQGCQAQPCSYPALGSQAARRAGSAPAHPRYSGASRIAHGSPAATGLDFT